VRHGVEKIVGEKIIAENTGVEKLVLMKHCHAVNKSNGSS
jgi:hypothetical protein